MKNIWLVFTIFLTVLLVTQYHLTKYSKKRRMDLVENSYETGCFVGTMQQCAKSLNVFDRKDCYDDAEINCPKWGKEFKEDIEKGPF